MASHGVPRVQPSELRNDQEKEKELVKINEYQKLVEQVNHGVSKGELTQEVLVLTSKLLAFNPEYYTVWNHRRRVLQTLFLTRLHQIHDEKELRVKNLISSDLQFLLPLLIKYPKCYWIWNHRLWLLHQSTEHLDTEACRGFWLQEMGLVGKMLARDSRNFHGWNYRRLVVAELRNIGLSTRRNYVGDVTSNGQESHPALHDHANASLTESEYSYTTKMIKTNFSNFSAWHNRSKLLPHLLDEQGADAVSRRKAFDGELYLLQSALFTDPYDQSLWFYHEYLMSELSSAKADSFVHFDPQEQRSYLEKEIGAIRELLEDTEDCKMIYQHLLLYTRQYFQLGGNHGFATAKEMNTWLSQLTRLDTLRRGRWDDLANVISLENRKDSTPS